MAKSSNYKCDRCDTIIEPGPPCPKYGKETQQVYIGRANPWVKIFKQHLCNGCLKKMLRLVDDFVNQRE